MRNLYKLIHSPAALLAFEAAARHGSFTRAAAELNVSQPAISNSVRKVENALGVALFLRRNRAIELTNAGERFYADVSFGLMHIQRSAEAIKLRGRPDHVTLSCSTAFAHYWLVPRLARFRKEHPGIEIRMETSYRDDDTPTDGLFLSVRRGKGTWPGCEAEFLMQEKIYPVCSPAFLNQFGLVTDMGDIAGGDLIHLEEPHRMRPGWPDLFQANGITYTDTGAGLRLNDYALVIQSAIAGQGFALGWDHVVQSLREMGLLTRPVKAQNLATEGFYAVWNSGTVLQEETVRVLNWLKKEVS